MHERNAFERELRALEATPSYEHVHEQPLSPGSPFPWLKCIGITTMKEVVAEGRITDPAAVVKGKPIELVVRYYPGRTAATALVFGGVHGNEDEGVTMIEALRQKLDLAYVPPPGSKVAPQRAQLHTFLVENLRASRDVLEPTTKDKRWVDDREPNRNFPLPGEGLAAAAARKKRLGFELVDPDTRRFPDLAPRPPATFLSKDADRTTSMILPENRLLMKLVACIKPARALSAHSHGVKGKRGDQPGVFIDPRGGFDSDLDAPLTAEGRDDDAFANVLLRAAVAAVAKSKLSPAARKEALAGNLPGDKRYAGETVHYSYGAPKARGTSFGMWAPAPIRGQGAEDREGIQTVTLELPKWIERDGRGAKTLAAVSELAAIWGDVMMQHFLVVR